MWTNVFLGLVLATGIAAGFVGYWWGQYWIWAALGVFVLLGPTVNLLSQRPFEQIRMAVERTAATSEAPADAAVMEQALAEALRSFHPLPLTLSGGIGLAVLRLMMFKPS